MILEQINKDFVQAFKEKDTLKKDCLGILKTKVTEFLKKNNANTIINEDVYTIITSEIKKRKQAIDIYQKNISNSDAKNNAEKEQKEIEILSLYLPKQMTEEEIKEEIKEILIDSIGGTDKQYLGMVMRYFNEYHKGKFDNLKLKQLIEETIK